MQCNDFMRNVCYKISFFDSKHCRLRANCLGLRNKELKFKVKLGRMQNQLDKRRKDEII